MRLVAAERLSHTRVRWALARAHLLYGEWLRRENRRIDAREQLRTAHRMVTSIGADGFAERAARELRTTGEQVRKRTPETTPLSQLTARETQISQLAGDGLSNPEIAAQPFMNIIVSRSRWASMRRHNSATSGSRELVVLSSPSR